MANKKNERTNKQTKHGPQRFREKYYRVRCVDVFEEDENACLVARAVHVIAYLLALLRFLNLELI